MTRIFAAVDLDETREDGKHPRIRFYRVSVKGVSANSKTRLRTGFYQADALHSLFGEMPAVDSKAEDPKASKASVLLSVDPASGDVVEVGKDRRFTVLYGTDVSAVADQISMFAESQANGDSLGRLLAAAAGQSTYTGLQVATKEAEDASTARTEAGKAVATLKSAAGQTPVPSESELRRALFTALERALEAAGASSDLDLGKADEAREIAQGAYDALKGDK